MRNLNYFTLLLVFLYFTTNAQDKYDTLWATVENLELEGNTRSASEKIDKISEMAGNEDLQSQIIKSFLYKAKYKLLLEENAEIHVYDLLLREIEKSGFPTTNILESILAKSLESYLDSNLYKIRGRSTTDTITSTDYRTWDVNKLINQIDIHYKNSLKNSEQLLEIKDSSFSELLKFGDNDEKYRNTLYDLLANRAIQFYEGGDFYSGLSNQLTVSSSYYTMPSKFIANKITDSLDSKLKINALKLYQEIEKAHLKRKDSLSVITTVLDRLRFLEKNNIYENEPYFNILNQLKSNYKGISSLPILLDLAHYYKDNMNLSIHPDYNEKAIELCNQIIAESAESLIGKEAIKLKEFITNPSLRITTEKFILPNKKSRALIEYKDIDSIHISFYKVPFVYDEIKDSYYDADSLITGFTGKNTATEKVSFKLPKNEYHIERSTEIVIPELPSGKYLMLVRNDPNSEFKNDIYGITYIQVTALALIISSNNEELNYQVVHRYSGAPIEKSSIVLQDIRSESLFFKKLETNKEGKATVIAEEKSHQMNTMVSKEEDSLFLETFSQQRFPKYASDDEETDYFEAKATIFTDRSIYRPGQKVYFKGVLTQRKNKSYRPVSGQYVTVTLYDANYDEVEELRLKTNEYGSVHGKFTLPTGRLNGEFQIEMDEDYEEDSEFWENLDDFNMAEQSIQVEEYKRPRFEISFDKITETYTINDTIKIKGEAKAFLGASVSNAQVKYTITREKFYRLNYTEDSSIVIGNTDTDQNGNFVIEFIAIADSKSSPENKPIYNYRVDAEITDNSGETRSSTQLIKVGYHSLQANILMNKNLLSDNTENELYVNIKTLNNHPVSYTGKVSVYKMSYPDRVLRKRPWNIPDIQEIPEDLFKDLFPNDSYKNQDYDQYNETIPVKSYEVDTAESDQIALGDISDWQGGKYIAVFHTKDEHSYDIVAKQHFTIINPKEKYLADNQIFNLTIDDSFLKTKDILNIDIKTAVKSLFVNVQAYQKNKIILDDVIEVVDGQYSIPLQLRQKEDEVDVQVSFTKYNCTWTDKLKYYFYQEVEDSGLSITLETFRDKLQPGTYETWKLKVLQDKSNPASAEVLASMYDMSLDTFKNHSWTGDIKIGESDHIYYNDLPLIDIKSSFQNTSVWVKNLLVKQYRNYDFVHNTINTFGFQFAHPDRGHNDYLNTISYHPEPSKAKIDRRLKAPGGTIKGIVTDHDGLPLPGVNIVIKGTTRGTQTDFDGIFTIEANKNDLIIFSYLGFETTEIKVHDNQAYIKMTEAAAQLEEVVVTAQGIQRHRKSLSFAVSTVNSEEVNSTYRQMLEGKVAGVQVLSNSGIAGSGSVIKIRGYASVQNDDKVLIIVDGVPFLKGQQALNTLDLADITMLRGKEAEALYGSRGANGVIIVTTKKNVEELQKVVPRKDLKETAFFFPQLQTDKRGVVNFNFNSPEALTKWKFQAFAYDKKLNTQVIQSEVITQKELSIVPNFPRFLREGDTITISAKIYNLNIKKMKGLVSLNLTDEITQKDLKELFVDCKNLQNFSIDARGNTSVHWKLYIPKSVQAIRYTVVAKAGKYSDGEESIIPVLTNRILVTESVPIWMRPGEKKTFGFSKIKEEFSETRQNHQITLEYTTNPTWFAIKSIPYLMEYPYECAEQTFARYYANQIACHILNSNPKIKEVFYSWKNNGQLISNLEKNQELKSILIEESPWLRNAQNEKDQQARIAELFDIENTIANQEKILEKLQGIQDASGGFPWFKGGNVNPYITRHIVSGLGHLKKLQIDTEYQLTSNAIAKKAIDFLDKKYVENYKYQLLKHGSYFFSRNDLYYFYARSFWKDIYPTTSQIDSIYTKHIPKDYKVWIQKDIYDKTLLALILARNGEQQIARNILKSLEENAVLSPEMGMYWKENKAGRYWHQSPIELQALIIEAFSEITMNTDAINELKTWLLRNKQVLSWSTTKATTEAIYALLLQGDDWLSVNESVDISFGSTLNPDVLIPITGEEAGTGYIKKQWGSKEITTEMNLLNIKNKSKVPQYGGYYWQYFEDQDKITSTETSLQLDKKLYNVVNTNEGEKIKQILKNTPLQIGDLVRVRIELKSDRDMEFVHMKDMRASGLEPINVISEYKWQDGLGYYESTKDAATNFFFDYLPKGVYVFEYDLRINNKGSFSNGITTLQNMYAPEFNSHSEGARINVE